jgi:outer membrane protein assembly factor BamB
VGPNEAPKLRLGLYGDIGSVTDEDNQPQEWLLMCFDRLTGKEIWRKSLLKEIPGARRHPKSTHANSTPATDGTHLVCVANEFLFCLDAANGTEKWRISLGKLGAGYYKAPADTWGFAASPILHQDRVIMQCDVHEQSWIAAFSLTDGKEIWRVKRKEKPTWSTPSLYAIDGKTAVVANGYERIAAYDAANGKELWWMKGGGDIPVPAPVVSGDSIVITNAHGRLAPVFVVSTSARGDIAAADQVDHNPFLRWISDRHGNYMQTPLAVGGLLFLCNDSGIATCMDLATGVQNWRERLSDGKTGLTASPVHAGENLYYTGEDGSVHIIKATEKFERIGTNQLGDPCMASPAVADGVLYFRTKTRLTAVGEISAPKPAAPAQ